LCLNISKITAQKYTCRLFLKLTKIVPVHTVEAYSGNEDIASLILNLGPIWSLVVSFTPWPLYPEGKSHEYPLNSRLIILMWQYGCSGNLTSPSSLLGFEPRVFQPIACTMFS